MPVKKPSITYWNRLEPRPRSSSIKRSLAAQVRDPLWLLGRQWQVGEFQGEDAGVPGICRSGGYAYAHAGLARQGRGTANPAGRRSA